MQKKSLNVGTLFSGIGAFEHALKQLNIPHNILFACDCGERELPITYNQFFELIRNFSQQETLDYCTSYINSIGVKKEYREIEIKLLMDISQNINFKESTSPIVLRYKKAGRKSDVKHTLILTKEQICALTQGYSNEERESYVNSLYKQTGLTNFVKISYSANYRIEDSAWHEDIRFFDATRFENKIDILVGGSPCQSFSNYGKKLGLEDVRGTLFYEYARIIKESRPKIFIYENVENVTKNDNGKTWKVMFDVWMSLGYHIEWAILDSKDYDHPQLRSRLFLIGFRKDIYNTQYKFPPKKELTKKSVDYLENGPVKNIYYLGKKGFEWITTPEKNLRRSRVNQDVIGCQTANQQDNWIGDFRIEHPTEAHYADTRIYIGKYDFKDGKGFVDAVGRKMTPRECLNLMGFDDSFKIVVKDSVAYRQSGNSIVVPVLKEIIKSLIHYI